MSSISCHLAFFLQGLISVYTFVMLIYALTSWFPGLRGRWLNYIAMAVEPVLAPVRRVIPPLGGFDLSFIVVVLALRFLSSVIVPRACYFV